MTTKRQPPGIPVGGQFAAATHAEPEVALTGSERSRQQLLAESARPLTVQDIEGLRNEHGTYDPSQRYHLHMPKVFEAAMEKASATPEGRRLLARRSRADKLSETTGIPSREILSFHDEVGPHEPGSERWQNLTETWTHIWSEPMETVGRVDAEMRAVTGAPTRDELVEKRKALDAEISAMDINTTAAGLRAVYPEAASFTARPCHDGESTWVDVHDAKDTMIVGGDIHAPGGLAGFDLVNLTPDKYARKTWPLRSCATDTAAGTRFDLDKMTALTAQELLETS